MKAKTRARAGKDLQERIQKVGVRELLLLIETPDKLPVNSLSIRFTK